MSQLVQCIKLYRSMLMRYLKSLASSGKEICEIMFKTITRKGADNKGSRHPSDIETIKTIAGCSAEELYEMIEKFRGPSRSFILPPRM